jgi:hypothetical protein
MSYKFGVGKYKTRDGRDAVVVSDEMPGSQSLCGWVIHQDGRARARSWSVDGIYDYGVFCNGDLMPPERWTYKDTTPARCSPALIRCSVYYNGVFRFELNGEIDPQHIINLLNAAERDQ